ncbi:hypothetical protein C0991_000190 [Blastosporella zonata]|nr:hypothetical protein C0991_000190 [Blastosporella zonata]
MSVNLHTTRGLSSLGATTDKNTHLKGRRRFKADLTDIVQECSFGNIAEQGFRIQKLQAGEDEGTIEVTLCSIDGQYALGFSLLISDTSDYPKNHVFFCSSSDPNLPPYVSDVMEGVASDSARTIRDTIEKILSFLAKGRSRVAAPQGSDSQEIDDDNSAGDYEALDQFEEFVGASIANAKKLDMHDMQNDFNETVVTGYRPGLLHFADDDFAISVSLPVIELAKSIPPRALMAWDRRLLSRSQHLTLLISGFRGMYPPLDHGGVYSAHAQRSGSFLTFKAGLTKNYKPGKEYAKDAGRTFGLIQTDAEDEVRIKSEKAAALEYFGYDYDGNYSTDQLPPPVEENDEEGNFDRFSLSSSLESLLDHSLLKLIQLRRKFALGWAGAELLFSIVERTQTTEDYELLAADEEETQLSRTNQLPHDPLRWLPKENEVNIPLTAFCYFVRRLSLCPRYCIVCHNKLNNEFEGLKPYYEIIHNPKTVDLLVSIAHSAASEQVLNDPFPIGLGLRVPVPDVNKIPPEPPRPLGVPQPAPASSNSHQTPKTGPDEMCEFDDLSLPMMRAAIVALIDTLPAIEDMKRHLERKVKAGKAKPRLKDLDTTVLPAAWSILRWCVASCTAHLEEITSGEESIKNLDPGWRQFRFSVGSPDAEAKFKGAVLAAQQRNANAVAYPSLYVCDYTHWIICRYLLVKGAIDSSYEGIAVPQPSKNIAFPLVKLDPSHPVTLNSRHIEIPEPTYQIEALLKARQAEFGEEKNDPDDVAVFEVEHVPRQTIESLEDEDVDMMDVDMDYYHDSGFSSSKVATSSNATRASKSRNFRADDWKHDAEWVKRTVGHLMPPPSDANPRATMAVQRELKAALKEQESANSLKELGWFMPPDLIGDNLFQWIVEMHSFDEDLPIARDLKAR